jgi:cysteine-rich repeat protein
MRFIHIGLLLLANGFFSACMFDPSGAATNTNATNNQNQNTNSNNNANNTENCGNGVIDSGEGCDDGNGDNTDDCPDGPGGTCQPARCGDGFVWAANEGCDDGNHDNSDSCPDGSGGTCEPAVCGDGFVWAGHEGCDDGNTVGDDGCSPQCMLESCGNGVVENGEGCDDGNGDNTDNCPDGPGGTCQPARCGDGFVWAANENCDDGNVDPCNGDCAEDCRRMADVCGDGIVECTEQCEEGELGDETCNTHTQGTSPYGTLLCTDCMYDAQDCRETCQNHSDCPVGQQCNAQGDCAAVGNTCTDNPFELTNTGVYDHTLENLTDDHNGGDLGLQCPGFAFNDAEGQDRVYAIPLNTGDYVTVWVAPTTDWNPTLFLTRTCPVNDCLWGINRAWKDPAPERIDYIAQTDETVYLVVDGNDTIGPYTLHVTRGSSADWRPADSEGDVIFNEVHANPDGSDRQQECEWFELYNPRTKALNLQGLWFHSPDGGFQITQPLLIEPNDYLLMAYWAEIEHSDYHNCGVSWISEAYYDSDFNLFYIDPCLLEIKRSATVIDDIDYDSGWPFSDGRSMYLCNNEQHHSDNDSSGNWRETPDNGSYSYSFGGYTNHGTPNAENPGDCP